MSDVMSDGEEVPNGISPSSPGRKQRDKLPIIDRLIRKRSAATVTRSESARPDNSELDDSIISVRSSASLSAKRSRGRPRKADREVNGVNVPSSSVDLASFLNGLLTTPAVSTENKDDDIADSPDVLTTSSAATATVSGNASTSQKKKPGRPKKGTNVKLDISSADDSTPTKPKRGRPKGSKNAVTPSVVTPSALLHHNYASSDTVPKKRGRPAGTGYVRKAVITPSGQRKPLPFPTRKPTKDASSSDSDTPLRSPIVRPVKRVQGDATTIKSGPSGSDGAALVKVPAKRGRPRKNSNDLVKRRRTYSPSSSTAVAKKSTANNVDPSLKKKRGRPRKTDVVHNIITKRVSMGTASRPSRNLLRDTRPKEFSLSPSRLKLRKDFTVPLPMPALLPAMNRDEAIASISELFRNVPDGQISAYHHQLMSFSIRLHEVEPMYVRASSPRD